MKELIRRKMKDIRKVMSRDEVAEKSAKAAQYFLQSEIYKQSDVLMVYMPLGNETDTKRIIQKAFEDDKRLVLPVTDEETGEITPIFFDAEEKLEKGGFSVLEPVKRVVANKSEIEAVIVPGIAFSADGARIGFGKGCYDMFLRDMATVKVGFCYDFQLDENVPSDAHDIKMDYLVTENGIIQCGQKA